MKIKCFNPLIYIGCFLCGIMFVSCNYDQFFQESELHESLVDSLKKQNDSLLKIMQFNKDEREKILDATSIYKKLVPSTVTIVTNNNKLGSGFFISDSLIATNYHVVQGATKVFIKFNYREEFFPIEGFVAVNKNVDLVILKSQQFGKAIPICKSPLAEGENIFVIGSPEGLPATISNGIISAKRNSNADNYYIQITAPISPGSSGGPVINQKGEVAGVSVLQSIEGQNLNFAIPAPEILILAAFKSTNSHPFSELVESDFKERPYAAQKPSINYPYETEIITEWNEETRVIFIKNCMDSFNSEGEDPRAFELCDCVYQKISSSIEPKNYQYLQKETVKEFVEDCFNEINR